MVMFSSVAKNQNHIYFEFVSLIQFANMANTVVTKMAMESNNTHKPIG